MADALKKIVEASSSRSKFVYDVFLSFRGEDTRKNFTDHLYTTLTNSGFRTFRDNNELKKGEELGPQLEQAIRNSEISVIVFSRDYASSIWCLNEVAMIMERKRTGDHVVVPVYYNIDPTDVRHQTGSFKDVFDKHEKSANKVKTWKGLKGALTDAFLITRSVLGKDAHKAIKILCAAFTVVSFAAMVKNGIKKVKRWREALKQAAGLVGMPLQNGHEAQFINNIVKELRKELSSHTVLSVAPFTTGSEPIVKGLVSSRKQNPRYNQKSTESIQLFSWHAFGQNDPPIAFKELSNRVISHCKGLPLALEVLGCSFNGRSVELCNDLLGELEEKSNIGEILTVLEVSYDSLKEPHIKDLFLDIACFFVGKKNDYVVTIYKHANIGIQKLIDRCLISVDNISNRLTMHELLQDMGRNVVCKESPNDHGERSRLWNHEDASSVIENMTGTRRITGIMLNENVTNSMLLKYCTDGFKKMHNLILLSINDVKLTGEYEKFPRGIRWLSWHGYPLECLPPNRYLKQLVSLDMRRSKLKQLDKESLDLPQLKYFNLGHSHDLIAIVDLSKLTSLKTLILKDCINLVEVHESIARLPSLTLINLGGCIKLDKLLRQINISGPPTCLPFNLVSLSLDKCNLTSFPSALSSLSSLRNLDLSKNPIRIISGADNINSLNILLMFDCTSLELLDYLPSGLKRLCVEGCESLRSLTFNGHHDNVIHYISTEGCSQLIEVDETFKLEPLGNIDPEIKRSFGFPPSLESINGVEVEMFNDYTKKTSKLPLQVLCDRGVYSVYLPGDDVIREYFGWKLNGSETWFNAPLFSESQRYTDKDHGLRSIFVTGGEAQECFGWKPMEKTPETWFQFSLEPLIRPYGIQTWFEVPDWANHKIGGLNIGIVFARDMRKACLEKTHVLDALSVSIEKGYSPELLICKPDIRGVARGSKDMIWLSHWKTEGYIGASDKVTVGVSGLNDYYEIKEIGIHIVYEKETEAIIISQSDIPRRLPFDVSGPYRIILGTKSYRKSISYFEKLNEDLVDYSSDEECSDDRDRDDDLNEDVDYSPNKGCSIVG